MFGKKSPSHFQQEAETPEQRHVRDIKRALGFHPDDPNIEVVLLPPLNGKTNGYRNGNNSLGDIIADIDRVFGAAAATKPDIHVALGMRATPDFEPFDAKEQPTTPEPRVETPEEKLARLMPAINEIVAEAREALIKAITKHRPMHGPHEGYAVLLEEVEELWAEIKRDGGGRNADTRKEAAQVAAMGMRYMLDIDPR